MTTSRSKELTEQYADGSSSKTEELRNQMERKVIQSLQGNNDENFSLAMNAVRLKTNQQKSNGSCGSIQAAGDLQDGIISQNQELCR